MAATISGRITNASSGLGITGMDLDVFDQNGTPVTITGGTSGADGLYTLTIANAGTYIIRADASLASGFVDQFYDHVFLQSQAATITVGAGSAITGINFSLSIGYTISGRVTSGATGLDGIDLDVFTAAGEFLSGCPGTTSGGGFYTIGALPPGNYLIRAQPDPAAGQFYVTTFYDNQFTVLTATPITVTSSNRIGININCAAGGTIGGTVTALAGGAPISGIDLDAYDLLGNRMAPNAVTAADGTYVMGVLPAGDYKLRVDPTIAQGYPRTYYTNFYTLTDATPITVTAGAQTPNINFALPQAGTISGVISASGSGTPLASIDLDCYDLADKRVDVTALSALDGTYQIGPLAPGTYHLRADPAPTQGYQVLYYNGKPNLLSSDPINVTGGFNTTNINFSLSAGGWIQGLVRNGALQPLSGIDLDAYDAVTHVRMAANAVTLADGTYQIGPFAPGQYHLRCDPTIVQGYAVEYYNSKISNALADPITVNASAGTPNINFTLDPGGSIAGKVTNILGGAVAPGIDIDVYRQSDLLRLDQSYKTDINGDYIIGPLPAGTYIVRADPGAGAQTTVTYYNGVTTAPLATSIVVGAGSAVTGKNIALLPADNASIISQNIPAQIAASHGVPVQITVQNSGNTTWSAAANHSLAVITDGCAMAPSSRIGIAGGASVAPGQQYTFSTILTGPSGTGACSIQFRMIREFVQYFGQTLSASPSIVAAANNANILSSTIPPRISPGQFLQVDVTVRNNGNTYWLPANNYRLSSVANPCVIVNPANYGVPSAGIAPNTNLSFLVGLTAPLVQGPCSFRLQMNENGTNFGSQYNVTINVANPPNAVEEWGRYE